MVINMLDDLRRANRIASQRGRGPGRVGLCLGAACVLLVLEPVPPDAECDAPEPAARSCPATRTGARRRGWLGSGVVARGRAVEHHRQRLAAAVLRVCVEERGPILDARHALRAVHGRPPGRRNTLTLFRVRSGGSQRMASCRVGSRCSARARTIAHGDCRLAIVCYPNLWLPGLLRQLREGGLCGHGHGHGQTKRYRYRKCRRGGLHTGPRGTDPERPACSVSPAVRSHMFRELRAYR